jgi:hypothetical protein
MPFQDLPALRTEQPNMQNAFAVAAQMRDRNEAREQVAKVKGLRAAYLANPNDKAAANALAVEDQDSPLFERQKAEAQMQLQESAKVILTLDSAADPMAALQQLGGALPGMTPEQSLQYAQNPELRKMAINRARTLSEIAASAIDERDFQQKVLQFQLTQDETERNNRFGNNIAAQNAATSRMTATPTDVREYEYAKRQAGGQGFPSFTDWMRGNKAAGAARTFNQIGANEGEFAKKAAGKAAEMMETLGTAGESARTNLARIDRLESLLSNSGGVGNNLLAIAGRLGIPLEGASEAAAAQAIIASMVPAQRVPGSGTTSDFDAKKFEQALPSLSGTPEGNSYIIGTMRALAEDAAKRGDIANRALFGEISAGEAREALKAMPGPKFPPLPSSIVTEPAMGVRQGNPGAALQFMQGRKQSGDAPASALSPEQQEIFKRLMQ